MTTHTQHLPEIAAADGASSPLAARVATASFLLVLYAVVFALGTAYLTRDAQAGTASQDIASHDARTAGR